MCRQAGSLHKDQAIKQFKNSRARSGARGLQVSSHATSRVGRAAPGAGAGPPARPAGTPAGGAFGFAVSIHQVHGRSSHFTLHKVDSSHLTLRRQR